MKQRRWTDNSC